MEASILTKIVDLNGLSVGILSLRTPDEWSLNIAIEAQDGHDSTNNTTVIDPELVRWIIDEALCLRHRGARVVLLLTKATWKINYNFIAKGTYGYVDAILAANQHSTGEYSCKGLYHNLTTKAVPAESRDFIIIIIIIHPAGDRAIQSCRQPWHDCSIKYPHHQQSYREWEQAAIQKISEDG